jgi:LmbE family N-acetylglucosaminyl deacetylase
VNILAIGAHPDDLEIGCAGTLIKYARKGHDVYMLVMTDGACGGDPAVRRKEQEAAAGIIGAKDVMWGGYHDAGLPLGQGLIQNIEKVVNAVNPEFIMAPYFDDTHQDHRHLSQCTISATRYSRNVLFYECPTTQNFTPTVFVDISNEMDAMTSALLAHTSQVDKTRVESVDIVSVAQANARFRGIQGRTQWAEGFMPLRLFINVE